MTTRQSTSRRVYSIIIIILTVGGNVYTMEINVLSSERMYAGKLYLSCFVERLPVLLRICSLVIFVPGNRGGNVTSASSCQFDARVFASPSRRIRNVDLGHLVDPV